MHNLSAAVEEDAAGAGTSSTIHTVVAPPRKTSSTFKRAGFKKKAPVSDTNGAASTNTVAAPKAEAPSKDTANPTVSTPQLSVQEQVDQMLASFLFDVAPLKQGASTAYQVSVDANVLHDVDAITQHVCSLIAAAQNKSTTAGSRLSITLNNSNNNNNPIWFDFHRRIGLPELKRCRRQYIQWVATHPPEDASERGIARAFIAYIAAQ